ncbi:MAG TPA: hypothetical protein VK988_05890, partial [Acidimicrobiales bacterium]|nr:hypothetical protein [Acidimicrobiales bacterium]
MAPGPEELGQVDHTSFGAVASNWASPGRAPVTGLARLRSSRYIVEIDARYVPSSSSRAQTCAPGCTGTGVTPALRTSLLGGALL